MHSVHACRTLAFGAPGVLVSRCPDSGGYEPFERERERGRHTLGSTYVSAYPQVEGFVYVVIRASGLESSGGGRRPAGEGAGHCQEGMCLGSRLQGRGRRAQGLGFGVGTLSGREREVERMWHI